MKGKKHLSSGKWLVMLLVAALLPVIEECAEALTAIKSLCEEKGVRLIVVCQPMYHLSCFCVQNRTVPARRPLQKAESPGADEELSSFAPVFLKVFL